MEKNQNIEINVEKGVKELVIRHGDAAPIREPKIVVLDGVIDAPAEFFRKRPDQVKKESAHVLFSFREMTIALILDEKDHFGGKIIGKLIDNPELKPFKINSGSGSFTVQTLKELFKTSRGFFASADENLKAISNLEKFRLNAELVIEKDGDDRGNKREMIEQKVTANVDLSFNLNLPVFIGQPSKKFKVDILFDIRDKAISIWLDSPELRTMIIEDREKIINAALEPFRKDFVIIED